MSKKEVNNTKEKNIENNSRKDIKKLEHILYYDKSTGKLVPQNWIYPNKFRKKDYLAIIVGLHNRFTFERIFLEKEEIEIENEDGLSSLTIGYDTSYFQDDLILEEKYSLKKDKSFVEYTNFWLTDLREDGVWGLKLLKTQVTEKVSLKQKLILERIKEVVEEFGEDFTLLTMKSVLKQKYFKEKYSQNIFL